MSCQSSSPCPKRQDPHASGVVFRRGRVRYNQKLGQNGNCKNGDPSPTRKALARRKEGHSLRIQDLGPGGPKSLPGYLFCLLHFKGLQAAAQCEGYSHCREPQTRLRAMSRQQSPMVGRDKEQVAVTVTGRNSWAGAPLQPPGRGVVNRHNPWVVPWGPRAPINAEVNSPDSSSCR